MNKIIYLLANGLAGFMDLAVGALIAVLLANYLGQPIGWWYPLFGAILGVLPDLDLIFPILRRVISEKEITHNHHESVFHWPLFMLLVVCTISLLAGEEFWGRVAGVCLLAHYAHDMAMMRPLDTPGWLLRIRPGYWSLQGRSDASYVPHDEWIRKNWLHQSRLSNIETLAGCAALAVVIALFVDHWAIGALAGISIFLLIQYFWVVVLMTEIWNTKLKPRK